MYNTLYNTHVKQIEDWLNAIKESGGNIDFTLVSPPKENNRGMEEHDDHGVDEEPLVEENTKWQVEEPFLLTEETFFYFFSGSLSVYFIGHRLPLPLFPWPLGTAQCSPATALCCSVRH
ncbi:hypothetical protein RIF29_18991 [Crotalaria pallida]|uniref:Uncharacterized protein n=1 Tax=Crotalaria pallida TaxID=3830 RepID=A0AAN9I541_CROPI